MINELKKDAEVRMGKSVESLKSELIKLRTGRAHSSLLEHIMVDYYGSETSLNQVANISVSDARTLTVMPWEKQMVKVIEKAIINSGMGLNPATAGDVIRVPLPPLTEERRKDMIKVVRHEGENARVAIRNIRRDVLGDIKTLLKEKEITEDDERKAQEDIQKITDKYIAQVDALIVEKEEDLMEI
ncbi:MAG: ribosome recycling factor [Proteobacteria bacterium]|jgi:ribosome recycling factor|nr:ribosome recycling factor [Pseudomonadota bacterium]MCG6935779.1 ribosome recycling factor [Pseudomonadota bacterium]